MKMGLWESTLHGTVKLPDGSSKDFTRVLRNCTTLDNWLVNMGPTSAEACPKANEVWTVNSYTFDVGCPGQKRSASVSMHFDSPESHHGVIDLFVNGEIQPASQHLEMSDRWIGAACGEVSPDRPTVVR